MRATLPLLPLALLLVTATPASADGETFACHSWETFVGTQEQGVGVSHDDGAVFASAATFYVVSDGDPVRNDFLFSVWVYQETNGERGLQRADPGCEDDHEFDPDCFGCF